MSRELERMNRAVREIDPARYRRLLSRTMPVVIETEEENKRMLAIIERLMKKGENLSVEEEKLLKLLTKLIEDFEQRYYRPQEAKPLEVLHHLMEARGIKQSQLWEVFGSKGIASEVLNGKRGISKTHARALANYFHVPVDLFV
jgi:HTH-type transcriptional regulator / antitoxin HigA